MHHVSYQECELKWWTENIRDSFSPISRKLPEIQVYSDACPNGWGAVSGDSSTGGLWKAQEALLHINSLETAAAYFAVKIYRKHLQNTTIHLKN